VKSPLIHSLKNLVNPHLLVIGGDLVQANPLRINQLKISKGHLFFQLN